MVNCAHRVCGSRQELYDPNFDPNLCLQTQILINHDPLRLGPSHFRSHHKYLISGKCEPGLEKIKNKNRKICNLFLVQMVTSSKIILVNTSIQSHC